MKHGNEDITKAENRQTKTRGSDASGVETPVPGGPSSGGEGQGPTSPGHQEGLGGGAGTAGAPEDEHHLQQRHRPRILGPQELDDIEVEVEQAFTSGSPRSAWEVTQRLITMSRTLQKEAATARFKANFGTKMCDSCDGLKAGPTVAATCFQLRQCYFTNQKVQADRKQARLIDRLTQSHTQTQTQMETKLDGHPISQAASGNPGSQHKG